MRSITRRLITGGTLATLLIGFMVFTTLPAGAAPAPAQACQRGGYVALQEGNGTTFSNVRECVVYAAHGGTLYAPKLTQSPSGTMNIGAENAFDVDGTGFHANSQLTWRVVTPNGGDLTLPALNTTNADGSFVQGWYFSACPGGSVTFTVTDADGVHASITVPFAC